MSMPAVRLRGNFGSGNSSTTRSFLNWFAEPVQERTGVHPVAN
jgi:hypothetical protein